MLQMHNTGQEDDGRMVNFDEEEADHLGKSEKS